MTTLLTAGVVIDVNTDVKHKIGNISKFDRSKFITIHSVHTSNEWTVPQLEDFIDGYDVYFGRETGTITWNLNNADEDPQRPGHVDRNDVLQACADAKYYRQTSALYQLKKKYEKRCQNFIVGAQLDPFWPLRYPTSKGWKLSSEDTPEHPFGSASAEYMALFIKNYYDENFKPKWVEVINEPAYWLIDHPSPFAAVSMELINKYHNTVADSLHQNIDSVLVGGYTVAFPDYYKYNFQQWLDRDKLFIDQCGEKMDFWSIHFYDLEFYNSKKVYRGSYMEAAFDIIDHYSMLRYGKTKPFVISEFGGRALYMENQPWSPLRDWKQMRSITPMLLQFMDRPHEMGVAVPFIIPKAEWGYDEYPYPHRLYRKANEPDSYSGDWVYTEMVKFYQLWKDVNGTRVDSWSSDLDVLVDAYVNENQLFVILSNLSTAEKKIDVNLFGNSNKNIQGATVRHLYLNNNTNAPVLEESHPAELKSIKLAREASMVIIVNYDQPLEITELSKENRYYADKYLQTIEANQTMQFNVNQVALGTNGEAVLRLGIGRPYAYSRVPMVKVNGKPIQVPEKSWKGYDQKDHYYFFGVLEIPVPYNYLQESNEIQVTFADDGGFVTSCILQVFEFSRPIVRSESTENNNGLPTGWLHKDIGNVDVEGSATYSDGVFTISGSGGIWDTDAFHFVYTTVKGQAEITAHLDNYTTSVYEWTKVGIMMRNSDDPFAKNVFLFSSPGYGVCMQARLEDYGQPVWLRTYGGDPYPQWLKLKQEENKIIGLVSTDGSQWDTVQVAQTSFGGDFLAGMAVTSTWPNTLVDAQFSSVSVIGATAIENEISINVPSSLILENYPNPFNPSTTIRFDLKKAGHVELAIYDLLGQQIEKLIDQQLQVGTHKIVFKTQNLPSGIYITRLRAGNQIVTRKMILMK